MIHWLTTAAHPDSPATGFDAGQKGWRLHAVEAPENATFSSLGRAISVCGTRPRHGWGIDLFIERRCSKCVQKLGVETWEERYVREQAAKSRADERRVSPGATEAGQ